MGVTDEAVNRSDAARPERCIAASSIVDPDGSPILLDHQVGGSVLLPTALQLGLVMAAVRAEVGPGAGLRLTDIVVEDPVHLVRGTARTVRVEGVLPPASGTGRFALRGAAGLRHLSLHAGIALEDHTGPSGCSSALPNLPGDAALLYPPMFHGPAFQVIERFGRLGDRLVAQRRDALPSWDDVAPGSGQAAQLIELLLQSCGVWELTQSGRMMRPQRVGELLLGPVAFAPAPGARAEVWPSASTAAGFDGEVVGHDGQVLLTMTGYRPVELGAASPEVVRRLRSSHVDLLLQQPTPDQSPDESRSPRRDPHQ